MKQVSEKIPAAAVCAESAVILYTVAMADVVSSAAVLSYVPFCASVAVAVDTVGAGAVLYSVGAVAMGAVVVSKIAILYL